MSFPKKILISLPISLSLCLCGFSSLILAKVRVVTTTTDLAAIAREVGGPHVEVTAITRGTADPHYVEAKPSYVLKLHRADLLIHIGLELEIGWLPALLTASRNGAIQLGSPGNLNASDGIDVIEVPAVVTRAEGDIHPYGNPHYWTDPRNGVRIADAIAQRLGEIDSANASDYRVRAEEFSSRLADRIAGWERKITPHKGKLVVTYHKSMSYLLRWLGLKQAGAIERKPGIPPSGSHIAALIQMMKTRKVPLVLVETFYPRKDPTMVAEKTGAKLLILPTSVGGRPGIKSYIGLFGAIVKEIAEALAAPRE